MFVVHNGGIPLSWTVCVLLHWFFYGRCGPVFSVLSASVLSFGETARSKTELLLQGILEVAVLGGVCGDPAFRYLDLHFPLSGTAFCWNVSMTGHSNIAFVT